MGSSTSTAAIQGAQILLPLLNTLVINELHWPAQTKLQDDAVFDYIVVGGGTAGSIVTTRLVQDNNRVLMLEAGDNPPITALIAGLFVTLPKSNVDYNHKSTFDPYAAGAQGNYTTLTAGKMLGGSASLNHFIHTRGCRCDYDSWAAITDDDNWSYENFLKYFIRSERVNDKEIYNAYSEYHGSDGPIGLSRKLSDETTNFLQSFSEMGHDTVLDLNANISTGYTQPLYTLADNIRQTPAYSYLKKIKDNPNLYVSKNTRVIKLLFKGKVAIGVQAVYGTKTYTLRARKEVIISAGVYNTPQILMLSGIGPEKHLNEMSIEVKADLPVGDNFIEQISTIVVYKTKKYLLPVPAPTTVVPNPLTIPFPVMVGAVALNRSQVCPDYATFVLLLPHDTPQLTLACRNTFWYRKDICDSLQVQLIDRDAMFTILSDVTPKSRGTIRLKSTDPFEEPVITTGFLTNEEDLENMVKYVKDFIKIGDSTYFKEIGAELVGIQLAECKEETFGTDDFWRCYIRNRAASPYHAVGTCAMGTVVDSNLLVKGFERLRIVDASIMPTTPTGAPNAAVLALAERAVDIIKNESYYSCK